MAQVHKNLYALLRSFQNRSPESLFDGNPSGSRAEALRLAGVHYMTVSPVVWGQLQDSATLQGYNDGLSAVSGGGAGLERRLSPEVSQLSPPKIRPNAQRAGPSVQNPTLSPEIDL